MFFKMSNALLYNEVMRKLTSATKKGDCSTKIRGFVFICMMADGADNFRPYCSAEDIARLYDVGKNQAKIVWEKLIELNVLRSDGDGYSVIEWMKENYIYGNQSTGTAKPRKRDDIQPSQKYGDKGCYIKNGVLCSGPLDTSETLDEDKMPCDDATFLRVIKGEL